MHVKSVSRELKSSGGCESDGANQKVKKLQLCDDDTLTVCSRHRPFKGKA